MDCSVTTRWTKRSNRFLKPTFDESKFPPQLYWYFNWSSGQHSIESDAAAWGMELDSGRSDWGGIFGSSAAHARSVRGQPDGRRFARCSPVGSHKCNRCSFDFRPDAAVERGTDAPAFPRFGGLGGVRRFSRSHPSSFTSQRRTFFRSSSSPQSVSRFSDQTYCNPGWRIRRHANRGVSRRKLTYRLFCQPHSDQRNECPSIYSNARGSGRKQLGTQSHQYAVAEQPAPY